MIRTWKRDVIKLFGSSYCYDNMYLWYQIISYQLSYLIISLVSLFFLSGLDQLLTENRMKDLTLMYQLFSRVKDGLKEMCTAFATYIKVPVLVIAKLLGMTWEDRMIRHWLTRNPSFWNYFDVKLILILRYCRFHILCKFLILWSHHYCIKAQKHKKMMSTELNNNNKSL